MTIEAEKDEIKHDMRVCPSPINSGHVHQPVLCLNGKQGCPSGCERLKAQNIEYVQLLRRLLDKA